MVGFCVEDKDDGNKNEDRVFAGERDGATKAPRSRCSKCNEVRRDRCRVPPRGENLLLWVKRPFIPRMFFSDGFFSKESFMHAKFGGLLFKRNAGFVNHLLHVRIVRAVVRALAILREMGCITALNTKVRTARRLEIAIALTIASATFSGISFCASAFSFASFSLAVTSFGAGVWLIGIPIKGSHAHI